MNISILSSVQMLLIQFNLPLKKIIPFFVRENKEKMMEIGKDLAGENTYSSRGKISIRSIWDEALRLGFKLVDVYYRELTDKKDLSKTFYTVYFMFGRGNDATVSEDVKKNHDAARTMLFNLSKGSIWRMKAFLNPLIVEGSEIAGKKAVSMVCSWGSKVVMKPGGGLEKGSVPDEYINLKPAA
jgi:hypothetical protein